MRNNLSYFIPGGGGSLSLGQSLCDGRIRSVSDGLPELAEGVNVIDIPQTERDVSLKCNDKPQPKSTCHKTAGLTAAGARRRLRVEVEEGYVVSMLQIRPDGTYGAMVRRRDEWLGTTTSSAPLGTRVTGVMVASADEE